MGQPLYFKVQVFLIVKNQKQKVYLVLQLVIFYLIHSGLKLLFLDQNMCLLVATFARV